MTPEARWQAELLELIADTEQQPHAALGLSPAGLAVYRNNYRVGLIETLNLIYPVTRQIVGEEFMTGLAREYSKRYASHSGNLHRYGGSFGDFLQDFPPAQALPYLADVARLEWAVHRSYYAIDQTPLVASALSGINPEQFGQLRFGVSDSSRALSSPWPVVSIWQGHQTGQQLNVDMASGGEQALVSRHAGKVSVQAQTAGMAALLLTLQDGQSLGEAAGQALSAQDDFDLQAGLAQLFADGLLSHYQL
ncbi:DNA-binding domain-containing protein [Aquitalea aquatilis]|uniref:HvfC/BufC N-terminal domain-containing protein n=1 Tax=Aquitalea aquatilis TaxID=1537400 RepID=UPI00143DBE6F|nr:putative DNA-binding domain-containing protein [Aquitalea aquatilis]